MMKTSLLLSLVALLTACASGVKPPPQCEGEIRPINGIQLSELDQQPACLNNKGIA